MIAGELEEEKEKKTMWRIDLEIQSKWEEIEMKKGEIVEMIDAVCSVWKDNCFFLYLEKMYCLNLIDLSFQLILQNAPSEHQVSMYCLSDHLWLVPQYQKSSVGEQNYFFIIFYYFYYFLFYFFYFLLFFYFLFYIIFLFFMK